MTSSPASIFLPPMRPQKRMLVLNVEQDSLPVEGRQVDDQGVLGRTALKRPLTSADFAQARAVTASRYAEGLTNYLYIRLKGRGREAGTPLEFKFLINPESIAVNHQTVDAESLTRGGPQVGLWGETTDISISGATAGQYFADTLVDGFGEYSLSYQNFMLLQAVYENNGYWFEGEAAGSIVYAAAHTLRQIQLQADVELGFGNFIWSGCFTEFSVEDSADSPYYNKFSLGFMVWKERYRDSSPWRNSIANDTSQGHSYEGRQAMQALAAAQAKRVNDALTTAIATGNYAGLTTPPSQMNALPDTPAPAAAPTPTAALPFAAQLPVLQQLHDNTYRPPMQQVWVPPSAAPAPPTLMGGGA